MRNIFVSLLLLSLTLTFLPSASVMAAKKATEAMARPDFKARKIKKGELPLVSIREIAYMTENERTLYFKTYREAMLGMEKVQIVFDYDVLNRSKVTAYQPAKKKGFFAKLFGWGNDDASRMPASSDPHGRGGNCDECIFAYNLSNYGPTCRKFPFGCQPPAPCNNNRGISCDPVISGVQGSNACIARTDSIRSTRTCDDRRRSLVANNASRIESARNAAFEYFQLTADGNNRSIGEALSNLTPEILNSPRAQQLLDNLWDVAYSDAARGDFFVIAELYRRKGITMPDVSIVNANGQTQNVNIANLNIYDINDEGNVFQFYPRHRNLCNQQLQSDVAQEIISGTHIPSDAQISAARNNSERQTLMNRKLQEEQRQTAARELRAQGTPLTVRNVLQIEECRLIDSIYDGLTQRTSQVFNRRPLPPRTPQSHIVSQGCPTSPDADIDLIYQQPAVCTMCSIERAVINNEGQGRPDFTHVTSRKWQSLMSTMGLTCGLATINGRNDGMYITVPAMRQMIETFGHCSASTYDWNMDVDASYINSHPQHGSIQEWSIQSQLGTKGEGRYQRNRYMPDRNDAFRNVYGISYDDAEEFFCDVIKGEKSLDDAIREARRDVNSADGPVSTAAAPLLACMNESAQRVNTLYGAASARNGALNCTRSAGIQQGYQSFYNAATTDPPQGMVMHNNEDCFVTKQIEYVPVQGSNGSLTYDRPTVAMTIPQQSGYNSTEQYTTYATAILAGATRPQFYCRAEGPQACNRQAEVANMQVTYPVACAGGGSATRTNRRRGNQ